MVQYRKGTRSRPQVKIPKQYHDDYEDVIQQAPSPPPISEPTEDPLIPIEIIKTEPIDVEENDISSFSVEMEEPSFADLISESPPTLIPQQMINPLAMEQPPPTQGVDNFTPIRLIAENLEHEKNTEEDAVASIQIAECHSMNLDEQEEENRRVDEGVETIATDVLKTDVEDTIQMPIVEDVELKEEECIVENHVGETVEAPKDESGTEQMEEGVQ